MDKHEVAAWNHAASFTAWRTELGSTHRTALMDLAELEVAIERVRRRTVIDMHAHGFNWTDIGDALGMTRQGASARYLKYVRK